MNHDYELLCWKGYPALYKIPSNWLCITKDSYVAISSQMFYLWNIYLSNLGFGSKCQVNVIYPNAQIHSKIIQQFSKEMNSQILIDANRNYKVTKWLCFHVLMFYASKDVGCKGIAESVAPSHYVTIACNAIMEWYALYLWESPFLRSTMHILPLLHHNRLAGDS